MDQVNAVMNDFFATLARGDTLLVIILGLAALALFANDELARGLGYVKRRSREGLEGLGFGAVRPVREPGSGAVQTVLTPNGSGSSPAGPNGSGAPEDAPTGGPTGPAAQGWPSSFEVLGALVASGAISTSRAYELLGVSRGGSARYQEAQRLLAAARARVEGQVNYQELTAQGKPTGRIVTRPRRAG